MTQTHTIDISKDVFPFSSIESYSVILREDKSIRTKKNNEGVMELPVNNYLKTPDEIEMEFKYGVNPRKLNLRKESLSNVTSITTTDGYLNIHNLDEALSGFMEENY